MGIAKHVQSKPSLSANEASGWCLDEVLFGDDQIRLMHDFMLKSGANNVGEFILEALNFNLACTDRNLIPSYAYAIEQRGTKVVADGINHRTIYSLGMRFHKDVYETVLALVNENTSPEGHHWISKLLGEYATFLGSKPSPVMRCKLIGATLH